MSATHHKARDKCPDAKYFLSSEDSCQALHVRDYAGYLKDSYLIRNIQIVLTYPQAYVYHKSMPRLKKITAHGRALKVSKGLKKHKGNQSSLARELGITPQAVNKKTRNPEFISLRQQAINKAMQRAGITEAFVYGKLKKAMDAKSQASYLGEVYQSTHDDHNVQLKGIQISLDLFQHTNTDMKEESKPTEIHVHYGHRTGPPKKIEAT